MKIGTRVVALTVLSILLMVSVSPLFSVRAQPEEIPFREPDWGVSYMVFDVAVSADGSVVAAATEQGLNVYNSSGGLLWSWSNESFWVTAVDVSDDGNVVVATICNKTDYKYNYLLFWKSAKILSGTPPPDWVSVNLWGMIGPEALAVSANGEQVVVVGTGPNVFFWNGALSLTGIGQSTTWNDGLPFLLDSVGISDDGDTIAFLGWNEGLTKVFVYKDCKSRTGIQSMGYNLSYDLGTNWGPTLFGGNLALSDDGNYVVVGTYFWSSKAVDEADSSTGDKHQLEPVKLTQQQDVLVGGGKVYFFNTSDTDPWEPLWTCELGEYEEAMAVDISSDGDVAVAVINHGGEEGSPLSLAIFRNATSKTGSVTADVEFTDADYFTEYDYFDVAIDGAGDLTSAGTGDYLFAVNASTGEALWYYNGSELSVSTMVKVSEDNGVVVSAGGLFDSLYYFGPEEAPPEPTPEEAPKAVGGIILQPEIPTFGNAALALLAIAAAGAMVTVAKRKTRLIP